MKPAHVDYFTNISSSYYNGLNFMWLLKMVWWCHKHSDLTVYIHIDLITKPFNATDNFSQLHKYSHRRYYDVAVVVLQMCNAIHSHEKEL